MEQAHIVGEVGLDVSEKRRVHVIACGVLAIDMKRAARTCGLEISEDYLPGGLHERPAELHRRLQESIDHASAAGGCDFIAVGYGLCGRGTVGIEARDVPLAIPRVHDCIALFLGSDAAYRREFVRFPGTYYISAGWHEEKIQPKSQEEGGVGAKRPDAEFKELVEKHGRANAEAIRAFLDSWKRNYQRAAFIDTGAPGREHYASFAKAMAEEFDWIYEEIPGDLALLEKILTATRSTDEVLVVAPGSVTAYDSREGRLAAFPRRQGADAREPLAESEIIELAQTDVSPPHTHFGLGIDAGGTYTDAVIYDFPGDVVLAKAKAPTTRWDFTIGIEHALDQLPDDALRRVGLVSVSTTLATNAIVEGRGQTVGLLVLPPYGLFDDDDIPHTPKATLSGMLEITGEEREPLDEDEIRRAARELADRKGVGAFAVSGFAGTVNPQHELTVKRIVTEETGLPVTCGHELSGMLNFRTRALTAVLNASIIGHLARFLREAEEALGRRGIDAPVMVVKGDGSLMSAETARERPVETAYSGPAASVAGARHLTREKDATVVDIGGTTTDTAALKGGVVRTCEDGSRIGGWKTHVHALDMRTVGLGGDSLLSLVKRELTVGPARVAPVAWMGGECADGKEALRYLERNVDDFSADTAGMAVYVATGDGGSFGATEQEQEILARLAERPHGLSELASRTSAGHWKLLRIGRLEDHHLVQRCGLTPTDLLHVSGEFTRWDVEAARRMCALFAKIAGQSIESFIERVMERVVRSLAMELLKKQIDGEVDPKVMDDCQACGVLMENVFRGGAPDVDVRIQLRHPVIGIGAPVHFFLPRAAAALNAEVIFPRHADVANAIGAITSLVVITRKVHIRPDELGNYAVEGLPGAPAFSKLTEADAFARTQLARGVRDEARHAGTAETGVTIETNDRISADTAGSEIFIERVLTGTLKGRPD